MPTNPMKQKIKAVEAALVKQLKLQLQDTTFMLEAAGGKVSGSVISASFAGSRDAERQRRIWDALDAEFGAASVQYVGAILAFTPDEWNLDDDAQSASLGVAPGRRGGG